MEMSQLSRFDPSPIKEVVNGGPLDSYPAVTPPSGGHGYVGLELAPLDECLNRVLGEAKQLSRCGDSDLVVCRRHGQIVGRKFEAAGKKDVTHRPRRRPRAFRQPAHM
jgi:hypothetical protein